MGDPEGISRFHARGRGRIPAATVVQRHSEVDDRQMANTPKKMKDPTEAALSAIQDALQIRDEPAQPNTAPTPAPASAPSEEKPWPGLRSKLSNRETAREPAKPA